MKSPRTCPSFILSLSLPRKFSLIIAALAAGAGLPPAQASTDTWAGSTAGNWNSTTWTDSPSGNTVSPGDSLIFAESGTQALSNTLAAGINIAGISFNTGAGTYTMSGNSFNLTAGITNNTTNLQTFSNTSGLTNSVSSTFTVSSAGGITISNGLTDTSNANQTTTVNGSGNGVLTLGTSSSTPGLTLTSSSATAAVTDTFNGTGKITIAGSVTNGDSNTHANGLTYSGTGVLSLSVGNTTSDSYSGATTVTSGDVDLTAGTGLANSAVTASGGEFEIDGSASATQVTRTSALTLNGGVLYLKGVAANNTSDAITTLTLMPGNYVGPSANIVYEGGNMIAFGTNTSANQLLTINDLVVGTGGSVLFSTPSGGTLIGSTALSPATANTANLVVNNFTVNSTEYSTSSQLSSVLVGGGGGTSSTTMSILPFAVAGLGQATTFVTYTAANGIQALTSSNYVNTFAAAGTGSATTNNLSETGSDTLTANLTINSYILPGSSGNQNLGANTLTVTSGALLFSPTSGAGPNITNGTLVLGTGSGNTATGYIWVPNKAQNVTISASLQGPTSGLVINESASNNTSTLTLSGTSNSWSGGTVVNGTPAYALTLQLGNGSTNSALGSGTIALGSAILDFDESSSTAYNLSNTITGNGSVTQAGNAASKVTLSGPNTYTGTTTVTTGILQAGVSTTVGTSGAFGAGTGAMVVNGGTLDLNGYNIQVGSLAGTGGTITNNNATASTPSVLTVSNTGSGTSFAGVIQNGSTNKTSLTLAPANTATLTLTGSNTYSGATMVSSGALLLGNGSNGSATGTGSLTVANGATIGGMASGSGLVGTSLSSGSTIGTSTVTPAKVIVGNGTDATSSLALEATTGTVSFNGANLTFNLDSASTNANDLVLGNTTNGADGLVNFANTTLTLNILNSSIIHADTAYTLITDPNGFNTATDGLTIGSNGQITGGLSIAGNSFFGASLNNNGYTTGFYTGSYLFLSSNNESIEVEVVPEPSTWALMLGGVSVLLVLQAKRRRY